MRLATKLAIISALGVLVWGAAVAWTVPQVVRSELRREAVDHGSSAARQISAAVAALVIEDQPAAVRRLLQSFMESDSDLRYLYVVGLDGEVMAHTFDGGFPVALLSANKVPAAGAESSRHLSVSGEPVLDVGYRLMEGSAAEVHLGISELQSEASADTLRFDMGVGALLAAALTAVAVGTVSRLFTKPLHDLADAAVEFGSTSRYREVSTSSRDEVGVLAGAFNRMGVAVEQQMQVSRELLDELEHEHAHLEEMVKVRTADLEETNRRLVEATEAKSRFLANMSHELRTPLNSIIGFSGIMLRGMAGDVTEEQTRQLGMISRAGQHLLQLVNDVLDLSKIEGDLVRPKASPFDLPDVVDEVVESLRASAEEKGIALRGEWPDDVMILINDERMVRQILLNLVGNAVKFTSTGSVVVRVRRDGEAHLLVDVIDTGPGIAPEDMEHVFEEYRQLTTDRVAKPPGTGLGLPVSRRLAGLLGGTVEATSEVGRGSTFSLRMPLTMANGAGDAASGVGEAAGTDGAGGAGVDQDGGPAME